MARTTRPVIAINELTGERKTFESVYAAAKDLGARHTQILISIAMCASVKGWYVYDTPENIRKRIDALEEQIEMLEG